MESGLGNVNGEFQSEAPNDRRTDALGDLRFIPDDVLCTILTRLTPRDVARLSCVSSVMYILCNEEPLWMSLCLSIANRPLEYKGSWKKTTLHQLDLLHIYDEACKRTLHFEGFSSLFLYRRLYRCYTSLNGFSFDDGNVNRRENLSLEEFHGKYDCKEPVLISGLADNWPAKESWTSEQLLLKYPDTKFRISQRSAKKINMRLTDYFSYMQIQHDEDPLYIFDDKFGEVAPDLLKDYNVPHLFQEDYFDVLDIDQRPPFRWLIIGPERSGASWHVDPGLTSAWNTLLCGRKRWALYPPGKVPLGVTVHVNEDDGDVNIETPSSLQWWLDFYPLLADNDKPIECTQLPGETIYVPSGWWHCVLNLETTIAVTQNFVNSKNFEFVCLDMAPGYKHKGVCRAGLLALDDSGYEDMERNSLCINNNSSNRDLTRKEKRVRIHQSLDDTGYENCTNGSDHLGDLEYTYDIDFLSMFLDDERDHYTSLWSSGNSIGQREMRDWLCKLWVGRPELRDLIWKGAGLALNAGKWYERVGEICAFHGFPSPLNDEKLPVGTGSNPVYLIDNYVIKIFAEGGLEASLYGLGTELEFHNLLQNLNSSLKNFIPSVLASGILLFENGSYRVLPWDGRGIPEVIASKNVVSVNHTEVDYPFGVWGKKEFEYQNAGKPLHESANSGKSSVIWPYIVTKRCSGKIFAELRDTLTEEDALNLASFLGKQLRSLHMLFLPYPSSSDTIPMVQGDDMQLSRDNVSSENAVEDPAKWKIHVNILNRKRKDVLTRLAEWGDPIPSQLIEKVDDYIPQDLTKFVNIYKNETEVWKSCTWIHSDVMDDNIYMTPCSSASISEENSSDSCLGESTHVRRSNGSTKQKYSWYPTHILDFSDLSIGEPILDLIPIHLDVFRGNSYLLKEFLDSYKLPFLRKGSLMEGMEDNKFGRLSYRTMCHCILHDENVLGAIFSIWKELRVATSWEEVEEKVWGELNLYEGLC